MGVNVFLNYFWVSFEPNSRVKGLKVESFVNPQPFLFYILKALMCKNPT
jgi:hypothetical protein